MIEIKRSCIKWICVVFLFASTQGSQAMTPADAYQRAEHLGLMIGELLSADLSKNGLAPEPDLTPCRPRHVLRLATNVFENVQAVRKLNGLQVTTARNTEAVEVKPADVVVMLDDAIKSTRALGKVYKVAFSFTPPSKRNNISPDNVMAKLRSVNSGLIELGAPKVLPNDVYRIALSIDQQLAPLAPEKSRSLKADGSGVKKATPAQALSEALSLVKDLDALSKSSVKMALPKGVIAPPTPPKGEKVTPADVLLATQFALADVYSLSVVLGNKQPLKLPDVQSGRNPADVKNVLASARLHVQALKDNHK